MAFDSNRSDGSRHETYRGVPSTFTLSRMHRCRPRWSVLLLVAGIVAGCGDGAERGKADAGLNPPTTAEAAGRHVRSAYFAQDNRAGVEAGQRYSEAFPDSLELAAWRILNVARNGQPETAVSEAQQLVDRYPENPWSLFALAGAMMWHRDTSDEEALSASAAAIEANPAHDDFLWLRAESLRLRNRKQQAVSVLEAEPARLNEAPELMNVRAAVLFDLALANPADHDLRERALEGFAQSRNEAPDNVNASYIPGWYLLTSGRPAEAYPLVQHAAGLSSADRIQRAYWAAIVSRNDLTQAEKQAELHQSISGLLESPEVAPSLLPAAAAVYGEVGLEAEQEAIEAQVLERYPESEHAEAVLMRRIVALERENRAANGEYVEMLQAFLARDPIPQPLNRHNAQRMLFHALSEDPEADPKALRDVVLAMSREDGVVPRVVAHIDGVIALASRGVYLDDAERLAEAGLAMIPELVEPRPEAAEASAAAPGSGLEAAMRGALGWVYFNQGRIDDARRELLASYGLEARLASTLLHLGTLYESEQNFEAAETWYIRCAALPTRDDHPCANVLHDYYVRREGSSTGFDDWLGSLRDRIYAESAARIDEDRLSPPIAVPSFAMRSLEGTLVTLEDLAGKVLIVKFWAVWCAPCRLEMPEFAAFASRHAKSENVEVVTISLDQNPDNVSHWLDENSFALPVLIDDGYSSRVGISGLPTTWFLDERGRKIYEVIGAIPELDAEYEARLKKMRTGATD